MARTDNLTNFLTDVADSIRAKKGTSGTILASNFDTEIASIESGGGIVPTGTLDITENGEYDVTDYASANVSVQSGGAKEYEYAEFDPFNVFEILDNDTEPCVGKEIILLINDGSNTLNISGNIFRNVTKIKTSDGQTFERPSTGTLQITFDHTKDVKNENGLYVRYLIGYTQERTTINLYDRDMISLSQKALIYYFKNYDLSFGLSSILYSSAITKLIKYDDNSNLSFKNQYFAQDSTSLIEFESKTENVGNKLEYALNRCRTVKKVKVNLKGATSIYYMCDGSSSLEEIELYNCPETAINQSSAFTSCTSLKKFKAYPYFVVTEVSFFNNNSSGASLTEISGVDLTNTNGAIGNCRNLVKLERIKNVGVNLYLTNCLLLSYESLLNVLNSLEDATGQTAKTMTLGAVNRAKLEQTEEGQQAIALAVSKNWTIG